jgi:hypothetical protein
MTLLDHRNTATTKKLDFKNSHLTSVGARYTTIKYIRGAVGIGLGTRIKHLRRTTSGAVGNGLGATMKYLRRTTSAAANNTMA